MSGLVWVGGQIGEGGHSVGKGGVTVIQEEEKWRDVSRGRPRRDCGLTADTAALGWGHRPHSRLPALSTQSSHVSRPVPEKTLERRDPLVPSGDPHWGMGVCRGVTVPRAARRGPDGLSLCRGQGLEHR